MVQDSIFVDECVEIIESSLHDFVQVFPNPNKGSFTIESSLIIQKVEIFNTDGGIVFLKYANDTKLNVSSISTQGIYTVRIYLSDVNGDTVIANEKMIVN